MIKKIKLGAAFATVGLWTLASRILGFTRDIAIAAFLGAGPVAEAFLIAFSLPNMFRRFFAEGALNIAFLPIFSKKLNSPSDALNFARNVFSTLAMILVPLAGLAVFAMPWLVLAMASGFSGDPRLEMAILFGRILFPYILLISLGALCAGILNATGRFATGAAAPVLLNIILISALFLAASLGWPFGITLSIAGLLAGCAQLYILWRAAKRAGFLMRLQRPRLTPDLRRLLIIATPAALAGGVIQINLLVGRQVASFFEGAIAWLNYADRLYQLPLGVIGIAIGVVLLPELTRKLSANDTHGASTSLSRSAELAMMLTLPSTMALLLVPAPLISVLFERGAFRPADTQATAQALTLYALGLPAFVLQKVLQSPYFAAGDTKRPLQFALIGMGVNAVIAISCSFIFGFLAAALATTIASWTNTLFLWRGLPKAANGIKLDARFWNKFWRAAGASILMGAILIGFMQIWGNSFNTPDLHLFALAALILTGACSYGLAGHILGAFSLRELRMALQKK